MLNKGGEFCLFYHLPVALEPKQEVRDPNIKQLLESIQIEIGCPISGRYKYLVQLVSKPFSVLTALEFSKIP